MKSKFAQFVDYTLGAALVFIGSAACFAYYFPTTLAAFCAATVTATAIWILHAKNKSAAAKTKLSAAASEMFFDFMFLDEYAPAKLLAAALKEKGATRHGKGVYLNNTAAFCFFSAQPSQAELARAVSKAAHYNAKKTLFVTVSSIRFDGVDGMKIKNVYGDDAYKLFASLGATPEKRFAKPKRKRFAALHGAFSLDKAPKYAALAAVGFGVSYLFGTSFVWTLCGFACAVMFVITVTVNTAKKIKNKR